MLGVNIKNVILNCHVAQQLKVCSFILIFLELHEFVLILMQWMMEYDILQLRVLKHAKGVHAFRMLL